MSKFKVGDRARNRFGAKDRGIVEWTDGFRLTLRVNPNVTVHGNVQDFIRLITKRKPAPKPGPDRVMVAAAVMNCVVEPQWATEADRNVQLARKALQLADALIAEGGK